MRCRLRLGLPWLLAHFAATDLMGIILLAAVAETNLYSWRCLPVRVAGAARSRVWYDAEPGLARARLPDLQREEEEHKKYRHVYIHIFHCLLTPIG